jgi:hypothetical protein
MDVKDGANGDLVDMEVDEDGANIDPVDMDVYTEDDILANDQFVDDYLARVVDNILAKLKEESRQCLYFVEAMFQGRVKPHTTIYLLDIFVIIQSALRRCFIGGSG